MNDFVRELKGRDANRVFVSILACSDVDSEIGISKRICFLCCFNAFLEGYLNKLDKDVPHLDVSR